LTFVRDWAVGVVVQVGAGPIGNRGELGGEADGRSAPSHSVTTSTASPITAGMSTVHRSIRLSRRSAGGLGRPGRGGFRNEITLGRTTRAGDNAAENKSGPLMIMSERGTSQQAPSTPFLSDLMR